MKTCMECGKNLLGRIDKKFCDDGCRNAFNNRKNAEVNTHVRRVNSVLRKNRVILQSLIPPEGKISVSEKTLKVLGFDFEHITSSLENKNGGVYRFCYEFGYMKISDGIYVLVRRREANQKKASSRAVQVRIP